MPAGGDSFGGSSGMGHGGMGSGNGGSSSGGNSRGGNGGEHNYNGGVGSRFSNIEGYREGYYDGKLHIGIKYEAVSNYPSGSNHGGNAREGGSSSGSITNSAGNSNSNSNNAITRNDYKVSASYDLTFSADIPIGMAYASIKKNLDGFLNPNEKVLNSINKFNSIQNALHINGLQQIANTEPYYAYESTRLMVEGFDLLAKIMELAPEIEKNVNEQKASDTAAKVLADKKAAETKAAAESARKAEEARAAKEAADKKAAEEATTAKKSELEKYAAELAKARTKSELEKYAAEAIKAAKEKEAREAQEAKEAADAKFKTIVEQSNFDPEFIAAIIEAAQAKMEKEAEKATANPEAFKAQQESESAQKVFKEKEQELKDRPFEIAKDYVSDKINDAAVDLSIEAIGAALLSSPNPYSKIVGGAVVLSSTINSYVTMGDNELEAIAKLNQLEMEKKSCKDSEQDYKELIINNEATYVE